MPLLSTHFTLGEACYSRTAVDSGIDNTSPDPATITTMRQTAMEMERVRELLGFPITITSWYRSSELNRKLGSLPNSQHLIGEAVDFVCPKFGTPFEICKAIIAARKNINFDQLILEHTWVHISFAIHSGKPRGQVISLLENNRYAIGLTDLKGKLLT